VGGAMALLNGQYEIRVVICMWKVSNCMKKIFEKIKYKNMANVRTNAMTGRKMNG
jgi:uncharacterized protein (DUF1330 family)